MIQITSLNPLPLRSKLRLQKGWDSIVHPPAGPTFAVDEQLRERLSRQFDFHITDAHVGEGLPFYWDPSLGIQVPADPFYQRTLLKSDKLYFESIRKHMNYECFFTNASSFLSSVTKARSATPISLYTPVVVASTITHGFTCVPKTMQGISSYNYFLLSGDVPCYSRAGEALLSVYDSAKDCICDIASTIGTTEDEADTFTKLYRYTGFSLQLYRIYFILTMQALKGVNVAENSEESVHLDCSGCRYHPRFPYSRTYKVSENLFGYDYTTGKRPRGSR